jgi:hypothetical protein
MKKIFSVFCFYCLIASISVHAEANKNTIAKGDWIADAKTGCTVWNPVPQPEDAIKWSGDCKNGKANGQGSLEWYTDNELQSTITGVLQDGRCVQGCSAKTVDGDTYLGEMKDNLPDGKGVLTRADGSTYEGAFKNGERHGQGTFKFSTGETYVGEWQHGQMNGKGELSSADGKQKYTGEFKDDLPHGHGLMTYEDGSKYEGDWVHGRRDGKGKYTNKDGSSEEETWDNGQKM